jgi:lysyl-tRNA synthetase class 2
MATSGSRRELRVLRAARIVTAVYAVATLVALVVWAESPIAHRTGRVVTFMETFNLPVGHSLVSFVVTALVTRALVGRKRIGWWAVVVFQVLGAYLSAVDLLTPDPTPVWAPWRSSTTFNDVLEVISIVVAPLALWLLWRIRPVFSGRLQTGSRLAAATVLVGGTVLSSAVGWVLLALTGAGEPASLAQRWWALMSIALGDHDGGEARELYRLPGWLPEAVSVLLALSLVAAVVVLLRSARHDTEWTGAREIALRRLLAEHGDGDSLGYFATRRDKSSIFSRDERAAVTYAVINGVSLASGDPIGRRESWPDAVARWREEAREYGWVPAVLSASEDGARVYAEQGLRVIPLGDEAILDPDRFDLRRTSMTPVRHAVQRATRAGVTCTIRRQDAIDRAELEEIWEAAERWRGDEPDRGFSMALNREQDPADGRVLVVTARDTAGVLLGMLSLVPWGRRRASLDVMRRSPEAPNGLVELMVASLMQQAGTLGVRTVSLNFCMFRGVYADAERIGSGPLTRIGYSVLGTLDRFWQLERLYVSNEKFEPEWFPRFVCLEDPISLPQVAIAAGMAEGFLPRPRLTDPLRPRELSAEELVLAEAAEAVPVEHGAARPRRTDQTRHRLETLDALGATGREGYPVAPEERPDHTIASLDETVWKSGEQVRVTGRVRSLRDHGGVVFADLVDAGASVQLLVEGPVAEELSRLVDLGDLLLVEATPGCSRNGTPSLVVTGWTMLAKALHPIPFERFSDPETRLRQRSTDLLVNAEGADALRARSRVLRALRSTLDGAGFCEVETPILQTVHGGATARPFRTRINVYGMDLYLRIAPELYLKRLVVGGLGAVYEIGRNFRNEGVDATHNPEFTSLEAYLPQADYDDMRRLAEQLVRAAAVAVHGSPVLPIGPGGTLVDVSSPWPVVTVMSAVSEAVGQPISLDTDMDVLLELAKRHGVPLKGDAGPGAVIEELYAELVEPHTVFPTFYVDFPAETSPLTRPHRSEPGLVERWDLVVAGMELGTAYSELTDPAEQRRRLVDQSLKAAAGDVEAMEVDEDFLRALELGMPPTGGIGIGVDRLAMLLLGTNIRGVLSFPFAKPLR